MIDSFRNCHQGERAFLIGNGPSLSSYQLELLDDEITFATKGIYNIFSETTWRPSYYIQTSKGEDSSDVEKVLSGETIAFLQNKEYKEIIKIYDQCYGVNVRHPDNDLRKECFGDVTVPEKRIDCWSDEVDNVLYLYNSSFYPLYQMANYMGISEICLIGCDLGLDSTLQIFNSGSDLYPFLRNKGIYPYESYPAGIYINFIQTSANPLQTLGNVLYTLSLRDVLITKGDNPVEFYNNNNEEFENKINLYTEFIRESNNSVSSIINGIYSKLKVNKKTRRLVAKNPHFSTEYEDCTIRFGEDDRQRRAHKLAQMKLEERNVEIYNATPGGRLDLFPRVDLEEVTN